MKILVVEDEPHVAEILLRILKEVSYNVSLETDGKMALTLIKQNKYDLILLDVMLPGLNGNEILLRARKKNISTPIIMLTAIGTQESIVNNLNVGADDYVVKPFNVKELLARIKAVLRRGTETSVSGKTNDVCYKFQNLILNDTTKTVTINSETVNLTSKEFNLLRFFLINRGKMLSREEILENVWGIDFQIGTNVVDVYVNYLRKKIKHTQEQPIIETVIGMGYIIR